MGVVRTGATKEGWDCLLEMVEDGAVESRRNPKLKATSKIPYPKHLQVYLTESKKRSRTGTRDVSSLVVEHDIVPEENEQFLKDFATKKIEAKAAVRGVAVGVVPSRGASSDSGMSIDEKIAKAQEEKTKLCIVGVRLQHNAWDKADREFQSMMVQAASGKNTMNSPVKDTLQEVIGSGAKIDKKAQRI